MSSDQGFWETLDLLIGREFKKPTKDDIVQEWVEKVIMKTAMNKAISEEAVTQKSKASDNSTSGYVSNRSKQETQSEPTFKVEPIECKFSHPRVRSKLEKLMGSNVVRLTDRAYMQKLQERILEDYAASMAKRIKAREAEEMERVKNLVLAGKIPIDNAPPEMANHPIMLIEMYCRKLIAERRAKIKVPKVQIPTNLYWDDTPDPPSGLSIEKGHVFRKDKDKLCTPPEHFLSTTDEEDIESGYMFTDEEYDKLKYESPLIKELRSCETVDEMYALADEIIGELQMIQQTVYVEEDPSILTNITTVTNPVAAGSIREGITAAEADAGSAEDVYD